MGPEVHASSHDDKKRWTASYFILINSVSPGQSCFYHLIYVMQKQVFRSLSLSYWKQASLAPQTGTILVNSSFLHANCQLYRSSQCHTRKAWLGWLYDNDNDNDHKTCFCMAGFKCFHDPFLVVMIASAEGLKKCPRNSCPMLLLIISGAPCSRIIIFLLLDPLAILWSQKYPYLPLPWLPLPASSSCHSSSPRSNLSEGGPEFFHIRKGAQFLPLSKVTQGDRIFTF